MNIIGNKYGKLTIIKEVEKAKNGKTQFLCKCDCGKEKIIKRNSIVNGHTKSCGCERKNNSIKHGKRYTRLYKIWLNMRNRCNNKNNKSYKNYGARGIKICDDWNDFSNFYKWAMKNGYKDNLSIERINVDKGYNKENCKWITMSEQAKNKKNSRIIEINGVKKIAREWAKEYNINEQTFHTRLKNGWSGERLLQKPRK